MGVASMYFLAVYPGEVGAQRADSVYGLTTAVSMGIIFLCRAALAR